MSGGKVVVDASITLKWVLDEPYTAEALLLLDELVREEVQPLAPALLAYEVASALYKRVCRDELSLELAQERLADLLERGPVLDFDPLLHQQALSLAHRFGQSASYDAHYLALAQREQCEFWTADERLWNAVCQDLPWVRWIGTFGPSGQ
ncbi:MAG TPA: type II toxin-antitoxin system VapC family toxin [Chloroflexota bacterium]|nr:type II toxin-antitoxin system VapC family toxin [Chloroflexota bacterium]